MKKNIVISAVNITEGGALTVLRECLDSVKPFMDFFNIIVIANNKKLFTEFEVIEIPKAKKNWFLRVFYEFFYFYFISKKIDIYLWFSLHDVTPNVIAEKKAVYCHNPSPFYNPSFKESLLDPSLLFFSIFYKHLYRINIKKNNYVIVQQSWIRDYFMKTYNINSVVVAHPSVSCHKDGSIHHIGSTQNKLILFYPAFPRVFKNIDILCDAIMYLKGKTQFNVELRLTINGSENKYSYNIRKQYSHLKCIKFLGLLDDQEIQKQYSECDVVLFPSKLETWGLPIIEAKSYNKPLLVSDLMYSKETVGDYCNVTFISPYDYKDWANAIEEIYLGTHRFHGHKKETIESPYCANWDQLWKLLTSD